MILKRLLISIMLLIISLGTEAQNSNRDLAISRAKAVFIATANGDVATLKQLMTPEFYKETYPYSDSYVREILLSVPYQNRKKLIDHVQNHSVASTIINRTGDVITVTLTNRLSQKEFTVQLVDEHGNGNWKVFSYWY